MDPLLLTLLGYPLGILANFTYDQLKKLSENFEIDSMKTLFLKSFYNSLELHNKQYDNYSKKVVENLKKSIEKNEEKILLIFSRHTQNFENLIYLVSERKFQELLANDIIKEYELELDNYPNLITNIIMDCLNYYRVSFFSLLTEKQGIQIILKESLKVNKVIDLIKDIKSDIVTKKEFDELRKILLNHYYSNDEFAKKDLSDYDRYLKKKFKYVEMRGFSPKISGKNIQMELSDVFVPMEIKIDKSILPVINLNEDFIYQQSFQNKLEKEKDENKNESNDPLNQLLDSRNLVILGDPGSGKSTLLKYLSIHISLLRNKNQLLSNIVPIFIRISDFADYFQKYKKNIYFYITDYFDKQYQHLFQEAFEYSNLLLLLDGLDEITNTPLRIRVVEQVMDLIARYPNNRYIVTSRIVGYQESKLGSDFKHFKLLPFGLNEIKNFSFQWYKSISKYTDKDYKNAEIQAESLFSSISRNPSVIKLASNPLLATIIAMIHYKGKKLPNKRIELYDISSETFLEYWVQLRMCYERKLKDKNEIIEILAPIAFEIHQNFSTGIIEEREFEKLFIKHFLNVHTNANEKEAYLEFKDLMNFLRKEAGYFYEKGEDDEGNKYYGFMHLTFEEFLAAIEFITKWNENTINLKDYVFDSRWIEIIRLASAQISNSIKGRTGRLQTSKFLMDILSVEDPFPAANRTLQIVLLILSDDVAITDELLNKLINKFFSILSKNLYNDMLNSFSKLINEVLFSDYKKVFLEKFKEKINTKNVNLRKNLVYLLALNSWDQNVYSFLTELINKQGEICNEIINLYWQNLPIQKSEEYKEFLFNYLKNLDFNLPLDIEKFIFQYFSSQIKDYFYVHKNLEQQDIDISLKCLEEFASLPIFDRILKFFLDRLLTEKFWSDDYKLDIVFNIYKTVFNIYKEHPLCRNLNDSLNKLKLNELKKMRRQRSTWSKIGNYDIYLQYNKPSFEIYLWSNNYEKITYHTFTLNTVSDFIKNLAPQLSELELKKIKSNIYNISGPIDGNILENINNYKTGNELGILYFHFEWESFPFEAISHEPELFSEIILRKTYKYFKSIDKSKINLSDFANEKVAPPVRFYVYNLFNHPFIEISLIESINYFNLCSKEEKEGVFSILYKILNPIQLV